jgi:colanic acid biosynthesis glycosyl transferase WcaI
MKILLLYHYFHPDDVISARLFSDLAQHLKTCGHTVEAAPCNRSCRNSSVKYPAKETWNGIRIERTRRPPLPQHTNTGRIANSFWMMSSWALRIIKNRPDIVIIGTDPQGAIACLLPIRKYLTRTRIIHWCHDVYPELLSAEGLLSKDDAIYRIIRKMAARAYQCCDSIIDIGPEMRKILTKYPTDCKRATITPWALIEANKVCPPNVTIRNTLFGDAQLAILYSGNYGRAHDADLLFRLARTMRNDSTSLVFTVRGNKVSELRSFVKPEDTNIKILPLADEKELKQHLESADIHIMSLRDNFSGLAVPSKFFGTLAIGRPVVYAGDRNSDITQWINTYKTGWTINPDNLQAIASELKAMSDSPDNMHSLQAKCLNVYQKEFRKQIMLSRWQDIIDSTLSGMKSGD